ncbi:MAG: L-fucose mutarotase [Rhizobiaceae bacterium]
MLRNIDPLLSPDLLHALRSMGHGDEIVIADAHFPGSSIGPACIRADGSTVSDLLRAVLSAMPLDSFVDDPALTMQVVGEPDTVPEAVREFQSIIDTNADRPVQAKALERFAFYERASQAFAIVQTGDTRIYANIILKMGVL